MLYNKCACISHFGLEVKVEINQNTATQKLVHLFLSHNGFWAQGVKIHVMGNLRKSSACKFFFTWAALVPIEC